MLMKEESGQEGDEPKTKSAPVRPPNKPMNCAPSKEPVRRPDVRIITEGPEVIIKDPPAGAKVASLTFLGGILQEDHRSEYWLDLE